MKKVLMVGLFTAIVVGMMGCASPGGMTYIGPVSYYHAKSSDKAMMMRTVSMSKSIPVEKKEPVFKAVNMGSSPNEIAVGVGVDMGSLISGDYTGSEVFWQFVTAGADAVLYGATGYGAYKAVGGGGSGDKAVTTYTIVNNGNGNNNNINGGSGPQSNNSASDGAANGDVNVKP